MEDEAASRVVEEVVYTAEVGEVYRICKGLGVV